MVLRRALITCAFALSTLSSHAALAQTIVAFGDSATEGLGLSSQDAYPAKLERALRAKGVPATVINAGVSGETSGAGLSRLDRSVPAGTRLTIVEFGINDRRMGVPPETFRANLAQIIRQIRAKGSDVLVVTYADAGNAIGAQNKVATIRWPTIGASMRQPGNGHLTAAGYDIVVSKLTPAVLSRLAAAR